VSPDTWIERVKAADAEAEAAWSAINRKWSGEPDISPIVIALNAIASELRAQRIARRPGGGVT
jgi:hypothetical protein